MFASLARRARAATAPVANAYASAQRSQRRPFHVSYAAAVYARMIGQATPAHFPHLLEEGEVTPGITAAEYRQRRTNLAKSLPPSSVAIVAAFPQRFMAGDIPYPFHQNTDFLYLCGLQEPDALLMIETPSSPTTHERGEHTMTLIVQKNDADREMWDGPRAGTEGAIGFFGADAARTTEDMEAALSGALQRAKTVYYDSRRPAHAAHHLIVSGCIARMLGGDARRQHLQLEPFVQAQRVIKSPAEMRLLRRAGKVGGEAFAEVMRQTAPGVSEDYLAAVLEFESRRRGAQFPSFPPVFAGGDKALTLHYVLNKAKLKDGDMILVDGGAEVDGYVSDISRTFPVNGRFSDAQRELYEAVLRVQQFCLKMCETKPGDSICLEDLHQTSLYVMGSELHKLGIIRATSELDLLRGAQRFYPHHVGHYLGMDTHDTHDIPRSKKLEAGMVVTIEPGVYLPRHPEIPARFQGIGIRIEDDVLLTEHGPEILTGSAPKEIADIERAMARR